MYNLRYFRHVLIEKLLCYLALTLTSVGHRISCYFGAILPKVGLFWSGISRYAVSCQDISSEDHINMRLYSSTTQQKCLDPYVGLQVCTCSGYDLCHLGYIDYRKTHSHTDRQLLTSYTMSSAGRNNKNTKQ